MLQTRRKVYIFYEECISSVVKVLREGRTGGARDFKITAGFECRIWVMCTDEKDNEELTNMYGLFF